MESLSINKEFYDHVKYLLKKERIEALKAYITAPEQLLFLGKRVQNDPNSVYILRDDSYSVYNCIKHYFRQYPDLLEHLLAHKFHQAPVLQSEDYDYLTPSEILNIHTNGRDFDDNGFKKLIDLFIKYDVSVKELLPMVYYCDELTVKSIQVLLERGVDVQAELYQDILVNPPLDRDTHIGYDKTAFLIQVGMDVNAVQVRRHNWDIEKHVLDNICNSSHFHIPYLFLYLVNGAQRDGFIHYLIGLKSKKALKFKHVLVQLYLNKNPHRVNEYNSIGLTPLHLAIAYVAPTIVQLLLDAGANPQLSTQNARVKTIKKRKIQKGQNALELAELVDDVAIVEAVKKGKNPITTQPKSQNIPVLEQAFHQQLLTYVAQTVDFVDHYTIKHLFAAFDPTLGQKKRPIIPPLVHELAIVSWGENLQKHHYQLLHIALLLGGQRLSWSSEKESGVIQFASWLDLLNKNIFCRHSDIGTTFVKPNQKNVRFNFSATYASHKVFHLSLSLEQYLEKIFQSSGLSYWMYCFTPPKCNLMDTVPSFEQSLKQVVGVDLKTFRNK